jgi:hypothetical protein
LGIPPAANWISNANRNNLSEYRSRQQAAAKFHGRSEKSMSLYKRPLACSGTR